MDYQEYYRDRHYVGVPDNPNNNFACLYNEVMEMEDWIDKYDYAINFIYSLGEVNPEAYQELMNAIWEFDHLSPNDKTQEDMELDQMRLGKKVPEHSRNIFLLTTIIIMQL